MLYRRADNYNVLPVNNERLRGPLAPRPVRRRAKQSHYSENNQGINSSNRNEHLGVDVQYGAEVDVHKAAATGGG